MAKKKFTRRDAMNEIAFRVIGFGVMLIVVGVFILAIPLWAPKFKPEHFLPPKKQPKARGGRSREDGAREKSRRNGVDPPPNVR